MNVRRNRLFPSDGPERSLGNGRSAQMESDGPERSSGNASDGPELRSGNGRSAQMSARSAQVEYVIQSVLFPRKRFTPARAEGWASLHGFDHGRVEVTPSLVVIEHRPRSVFDASTLRPISLTSSDGVRAWIGRQVREVTRASARLAYLRTPADRARYERFSERLRFRAIMDVTRVTLGADIVGNEDLVTWYRAWFFETHPDPSLHEWDVAKAVMEGLGQASRAHACDYVCKLGGAARRVKRDERE